MNSRDIVELYNDTKNGHVTLTDFINRFNVLTEEVLAAKVVDPGQGRLRGGDDVFLVPVIKISELHNASSLKLRLVGWAAHRWAKTIKAL
jgi:hypothetical protein